MKAPPRDWFGAAIDVVLVVLVLASLILIAVCGAALVRP
jgi:hypothetical protein